MCQQMIEHWAEGEHLLTNATSVTAAECDYVVKYYAASGFFRTLFLMIIIVPQWRRLTSLTRYLWREDVFMLTTPNRVIFWRTIAILCIHAAMAQIAMNDIGAILMQITYIAKLSIASQSDDPEACARTIIDSLGGTISDLYEWGKFMYNLMVLLMVINSVGAVYFLWIELIQLVSFVSLHRTVLFMRVCFGLHLFGAFVFVLLVGPVGKVALEIPRNVFQLLMVIIIGIFGYKYSAMVRLSVHSINEDSKATSVAKLRTLVRGIAKFVVWYLALQALQVLFDEILTDHAACPADESVTLLKLLMLTRITSDITYYFDRSKEKDWFHGRSSTASAFRRVTVVPVSAMAQRISSAPFHPPSLARGASLSRIVPSLTRGESASKVGAW